VTSLVPTVADPVADVGGVLQDLVHEQAAELVSLDSSLRPFADAISTHVLGGGKRVRAKFVMLGYRAAGGLDVHVAAQAGAAVELVHAYALLHDDVMDRSDTRRGRPSFHRVLEQCHRASASAGDSHWFGMSAAVLAGDLVAAWADDLVADLPVDAATLRRGRRVFAALRREAAAGQYLDLCGPDGADGWRRIALLKSARYSVTRPLLFGAALAGPTDERLTAALEAYGDHLGVAYQLRDDVLGMFGDTAEMGKSNLDDVRQGKRTLLVSTAELLGGAERRAELAAALGDPAATPDTVDRVRQIIASSGALAHVEDVIVAERDAAICAVRSDGVVDPVTADALSELARRATSRRG
jgi:geranylgeranyl diphosphate synthase type I